MPEEVRRAPGLEGDGAVLPGKTERGTYAILPAPGGARDQRRFCHPEMQARIAEAQADLRAGCVTRTHGVAEARALLDGSKSGRIRPCEPRQCPSGAALADTGRQARRGRAIRNASGPTA